MEQVNQNATGAENQVSQSVGSAIPPADLSQTNGDTQPENSPSSEPEDISEAPNAAMSEAEAPQADVQKPDPYQDLVSTFHNMQGSLNASQQHEIGSRIAAVGTYLEEGLKKEHQEQVGALEVKVQQAEAQRDAMSENLLQAQKEIEFCRTTLDEANKQIAVLKDELKMLSGGQGQ